MVEGLKTYIRPPACPRSFGDFTILYILPPAAAAAAGFGIIDAVIIRVEAAGCLTAEAAAAAAAAAAVASLSVATGDSSLMEQKESTLAAAEEEEEGRSVETCRSVRPPDRGFQSLIVHYFSSLLAVLQTTGHSTRVNP